MNRYCNKFMCTIIFLKQILYFTYKNEHLYAFINTFYFVKKYSELSFEKSVEPKYDIYNFQYA